jgi:hypothetical protein
MQAIVGSESDSTSSVKCKGESWLYSTVSTIPSIRREGVRGESVIVG